jgi:hypothetical protein
MAGYKAKTIKSILTKKIDKWVATIDDEEIRKLVAKNVIVTGGAIVSMLQGEEVNDFDVYLRDYDTTLAVANYYVNKFKEKNGEKDFKLFVDPDFVFSRNLEDKAEQAEVNGGVIPTDDVVVFASEPEPAVTVVQKRVKIVAKSAGIVGEETETGEYKYFEGHPDGQAADYIAKVMDNPGETEDTLEDTKMELVKENEGQFRPVFLSSNAITLSDKIQIVLRFYGEPDTIHENYDFVHCTSYWTSWDGNLVLRQEALESILSKELKYVGSKYPVCSIVRLRKFITRGWRINAGQILKMCMQISQLDLTSIEVLEDQLTGVDTAYFVQLISNLKAKDPEKVNAGYLIEIIDRMF